MTYLDRIASLGDGSLTVSSKVIDRDRYELFCYSRDTFLTRSWNNVTKHSRGHIFKNGELINNPFPKLFNVGEVKETRLETIQKLMETEHYQVYDKANGHLFIATVYHDQRTGKNEFHYTTKGSFSSDMIDSDMALFPKERFENFFEGLEFSLTFLFEPIVEHDKHTMYDVQSEMYGENQFVLLAVRTMDFEVSRQTQELIAIDLGFPIVKMYELDEIGQGLEHWHEHKGIEGYVIHFPALDFRTKVKTTEYWSLRFKKDLTPERCVSHFVNGGTERLKRKLPEEVDDKIVDIVAKEYVDWYYREIVDKIPADVTKITDKKVVSYIKALSKPQKAYLFAIIDKHPVGYEFISGSKMLRLQFRKWLDDNDGYDHMEKRFNDILN